MTALKQTRRSVSVSGIAHAAVNAHAEKEGITAAELVTRALRAYGVAIPEQQHRPRELAERAVLGKLVPTVAAPKPLRLARGPARGIPRGERKAPRTPSAKDLDELLAECRRGVSNLYHSDYAQRESAKRRVSLRFSHELRKRGWLAEEGYAPGSWADPKNTRRAA